MSDSSAAASLRWVRYEDIFYPAVLVPNADAPAPVQDGHCFVYFLGAESGAVVSFSDVEPYDPHNVERASHPAAAAGVLAAQQLLAPSYVSELLDDEMEEREREGEGTAPAHRPPADLVLPEGTPRHTKKKKKEKTRKNPSDRREQAEEDAENDLLLPRTKRSRASRSAVERSGSSNNNNIRSTSSIGSGSVSGDDQANIEYEIERLSDDATADSLHTADEEEDHWQRMAKDIGADAVSRRYSRANGRSSGVKHNSRNGGIGDDDNNDAVAMGFAHPDNVTAPFLAEIRHYYHKALTAAAAEDRLVNMQEADLVRAVEAHLLAWRGEMLFLERALQSRTIDNEPMDNDTAANIRARIHSMRLGFNVERTVQSLLCVVPKLEWRDRPARHGPVRRSHTSTDASLMHLNDPRAASAVPREMTQQLVQKYVEQRGRRERILAAQQGLGRTGFAATQGHVMEKWRQSRQLLVLDHRRETQPVSRRYSQTLAKVERHALKCINTQSQNMGEATSKLLSSYRAQKLPTFYNFHTLRDDRGVCAERGQPYQASSSHPFFPSGLITRDEPDDDDEEEEEEQVVDEEEEKKGEGEGEGEGEGNENGQVNQNGRCAAGMRSHGNNNNKNNNNKKKNKTHGDTFSAPLISPLHTSFDPRATFAVNVGDIQHENTLAEQLAMKSMQYSHSICLPSQEAVWERSEAYDASVVHSVVASRRHGTSRAGSVSRRGASRASSRASSVGRDEKKTESQRRGKNDWRASAKRAVLEQLTLYLRGLKGKPAVINKSQFQIIAKELLERAVRSESERSGLSMSLQANNANTPFTKDTEARLRKSVDNYVQRHFLATRTPGRDSVKEYDAWQSSRSRKDEDEDMRSVMGDRHDAEDSPVYQP